MEPLVSYLPPPRSASGSPARAPWTTSASTCAAASCHALCGENGAGKSTLGKILAGIEKPDAGELLIDGRRYTSPIRATRWRAGIGMVHQELAFCPNLTVAENLCLGDLPGRAGFFSRGEM